ncbi:PREDICTED: NEDD4 family-interacting protein 1-like isoform X1 [Eufriesea mexicana]|uniref:NEDD4 family-interacting protein 1-like isoform X1 n=1 Tax=Eufriesea mexicana TaxID=516756 RepID=UPI00083BCC29|nr:PREDICTED: NEDD4 family-interacting protein 1-like isoform X1 [Eufriesea mexicana]
MDSSIHYNMPSQTNSNSNGESSSQNEIPTLTVSLPVMQNDIINSGNIAAAQTSIENRMTEGEEIPPPKADFSAPPPYEVATKLPSYEEVQREKTLQGEPCPQIHMPENIRTPPRPLTILAIDTEAAEGDPESGLLGTDFMFFIGFLVAFLFNWIGFLFLLCFCHTIASRYGALAGFGLSLTKWTLIVKHSTDLASRENSWLWWVIMGFGVLICARALVQYVNIKRGWRLLPGSAQERLLFFY